MNEVAIRSHIPTEHEMQVFQLMAGQAIASKMYANNFKDASGVLMVILAARELGIQPLQALNGGLNLINGKVEISARMMGALIRRSGHKFKTTQISPLGCTIVGIRGDTGESQTASFTVAEAQQAGLVKQGGGWTKWPSDMCYARALSRLARQLFQDVIGIGYVEGEIQESNEQVILSAEFGSSDIVTTCLKSTEEEKPIDIVNDELDQSFNAFLVTIPDEDRPLFGKYISVVSSHMKWSGLKLMDEFLKDQQSTRDKFNKWKEKNA